MKTSAFINGFLGGIILGLLFAPASGEETRRKLNEGIARWRDRNSEYLTDEWESGDTREALDEIHQPITVD
jgi:gas vesicle protein